MKDGDKIQLWLGIQEKLPKYGLRIVFRTAERRSGDLFQIFDVCCDSQSLVTCFTMEELGAWVDGYIIGKDNPCA